MKMLPWIACAGVLAFGVWHVRSHAAPSARDVEPALRDYLASKCAGSASIGQLDNVRVGEYVPQFGGWPVYADHAETCQHQEGVVHTTMTFNGEHDAQRAVAAVFVRRSVTGRVEVFIPEIFQAGEREMQQSLQKAMDSMEIKTSR